MRTYRRLSVRLSKRERKELSQLLRKGLQPVRTVLRYGRCLIVQVPPFVKEGETIRVNTADGSYLGRK